MFNDIVRAHLRDLSGSVYDLGGGSAPAYREFIPSRCRYISCDATVESRPDHVVDLERPLPLPDGCADVVLLFNVLEHIYGHGELIAEINRVLKPGGRCLLFVPFLFPYHVHATESFSIRDFFRYTADALRRLFTDAGFSATDVIPVGGIQHVIAQLVYDVMPVRVIRAGVFMLMSMAVKARGLAGKARLQGEYALGYFVTAIK
jgi:SAM-dependent methyltransferase